MIINTPLGAQSRYDEYEIGKAAIQFKNPVITTLSGATAALRAIRICQPLRVPPTGYEKWKELQLNFDAREMLEG